MFGLFLSNVRKNVKAKLIQLESKERPSLETVPEKGIISYSTEDGFSFHCEGLLPCSAAVFTEVRWRFSS